MLRVSFTRRIWLRRAGFGLAVLACWAALLDAFAPELFGYFLEWGTYVDSETRTQRLEDIVEQIDHAVAGTIRKYSPTVRVIRHTESHETVAGVRWRTSRTEVQLPPAADVPRVASQIVALSFDPEWEVRVDSFRMEPYSITLQVSAMGYPTHLVTLHPTMSRVPAPSEGSGSQAHIALLIDDFGFSMRTVGPFLELPIPVALAIVPFSPYALTVAEEANARGREILVHLPMEPITVPGRPPVRRTLGQLRTNMTLSEIRKLTRRALLAVPYAIGINNHQGSAFMRDRARTRAMLEVVRGERMFFVDSRTIAGSLGLTTAREIGLPALERQVFLDTDASEEGILQALRRLEATAVKRGRALGIGHPYPATVKALQRWIPQAENAGFEFVPVSTMLEAPARTGEEAD